MKLRLPIVLLNVLLSSAAVTQASDPIEATTITIEANESKKVSENTDIEALLQQKGSGNEPQTIVKDGQGTLIIDKGMTLTNSLEVSKGGVQISGVEITNENPFSVKGFTVCAAGSGDNASTMSSENLTISGGSFTNSGTLNIKTDTQTNSGGLIVRPILTVEKGGSFTNSGTLNIKTDTQTNSGGLIVTPILTVEKGGTFTNSGSLTTTNLTVKEGGTFTNSGSLTTTNLTVKEGGTFEITGNKASVDIDKLSLEQGSKFVVNAEVSNENTTTPVVGGKISKVFMKGEEMEGTMTLNFIPTENLKPGVYSMFEYIADPGLENMTVTGLDGVNYKITIDGETIVITLADQLIVRMDPLADAVQAANWGVFQSSQAFTGILWAPHTNAVILTPTDALHSTGYNVAWAAAYSQFSEIGGSNRFSDHDYSIYGMAVGGEHRFASGRIIGAALGYDQGKAYPTGVNNVDQTSLHGALYGCAGLWYIGSMGTISADWSVAAGTTESEHKLSAADWEQDSLQMDLRATYIHKLDSSTYVNGFVGMQYYAQDGVRTSRIHADSMQNLRMMLGGGVTYVMGETTLFGELAIHNDTMRHNPKVEVDGFRFGSGANPGRFGGSFSVGAEYMLTPKWTLRGTYSYECSADHKQHSLNFGAVYSF